MLIFGRRQLAGLQASHGNLTKARLRIVHKVFNSRKLVYRNQAASNRCALVVSSLEKDHERERATQRINEQQILTDFKRAKLLDDTCIPLKEIYEPIDLTEPKDFYRFGLRVSDGRS
jgi:hypothetical protein